MEKFYTHPYWVKAEMHKLNWTTKGHCFPELVQKDGDKIVAQMRGTIWNTQFTEIRRRFESVVKEPLRDGLSLLFLVQVKFDSVYGLSLQIIDIDPNYTLGELHREREETLKKLKSLQLLNKNQQLVLPMLPKNIAVISVASSKGLNDFNSVLFKNEFGYQFTTVLFPAILDGDRAVASILQQLEKIRNYVSFFDAVTIVRGGGGEIGMTCYNDFRLCEAIATFPLPVLTGIGHSTNLTVAEMIAYKSEITPTKLADFFVQTFRRFDLLLKDAHKILINKSRGLLLLTKRELNIENRVFRNTTIAVLLSKRQIVKNTKERLRQSVAYFSREKNETLRQTSVKILSELRLFQKMEAMKQQSFYSSIVNGCKKQVFLQSEIIQQFSNQIRNKLPDFFKIHGKELENLSSTVRHLDPQNLLQKGYSISLLHNKVISSENVPQQGDKIQMITAVGELEAIVQRFTEK